MSQEVKIDILSTSSYTFLPQPPPPPPPSPPPPPTPNLPRADLIVGSRENYIDIGVHLYEASICGDWQAAKAILDIWPELVRFAITENYETALHVAASAEDTSLMEGFVKNLVNLMDEKDLELQNKNYNTALSLAAAAGNVKVAEIMVTKNKALLKIPGNQGMMPLYQAALFGKHHMVKNLYDTDDFRTDRNRGWVLLKCVQADMFDVAQKIVADYPELTSERGVLQDVLLVLAQKSDAINRIEQSMARRIINSSINRIEQSIIRRIIHSISAIIYLKVGPAEKDGDALQLLRIIWGEIRIMCTHEIDGILRGPMSEGDGMEQYPSRILFVAAKMGNTRFVVELLRAYPDLIRKVDDDGRSIIHIAVLHRHEDIYNLLYEMGSMKDLIASIKDRHGNNMLHLVGMSPNKEISNKEKPRTVLGVPMLMHREAMWFEEVEKMMPPSYRQGMNKHGQTPYELFSENNKGLVSQGLKWMKDGMVVATLLVTVAFAVAFTVPGGYDEDNGIPIFIQQSTFMVFIVADAISLVSSSASLLVFLSIHTSPYDQRDFLVPLPRKLLIGIITLFVSMIAMLVAFSASFFILYHNRLKLVPILISVFASMPLILFATLQRKQLIGMCRALYDTRHLFKPKKRMLYGRNKRF